MQLVPGEGIWDNPRPCSPASCSSTCPQPCSPQPRSPAAHSPAAGWHLKEMRPVVSSGKASMHRITRQSPLSTESWPHHTLVRKACGQRAQLQGSGPLTPSCPGAPCAPPLRGSPLAPAQCPLGPPNHKIQWVAQGRSATCQLRSGSRWARLGSPRGKGRERRPIPWLLAPGPSPRLSTAGPSEHCVEAGGGDVGGAGGKRDRTPPHRLPRPQHSTRHGESAKRCSRKRWYPEGTCHTPGLRSAWRSSLPMALCPPPRPQVGD